MTYQFVSTAAHAVRDRSSLFGLSLLTLRLLRRSPCSSDAELVEKSWAQILVGQRLKSMIRKGQGYMEGSCQKGVTASRRNGMKMPIYLPNVCERSRTKRHLWRFMLGLCYGAWRGGFSTREAGSSKSASKCAFPC